MFGIVKQIPWNCIIGKSILRKLHGHLFLIFSHHKSTLFITSSGVLYAPILIPKPQSLQQHQLDFQCNNCHTIHIYILWSVPCLIPLPLKAVFWCTYLISVSKKDWRSNFSDISLVFDLFQKAGSWSEIFVCWPIFSFAPIF